jgi:tetratricopeptide (TPR) repeat protein
MNAWGLVMRALSHFWRVTRADYVIAQELLEKAIAIDPHYGQALAVLSASHTFCAYNGWSEMATSVPIAERAALAAIRADSEDPWAHHALGCVHVLLRRFDDGLAEFELALSLNPSFALALSVYGLALAFCGRGRKPVWPPRRPCASVRAIRLRPSTMASPPTPSSSDEITRRRCGWPAQAFGFAPIMSLATAC